MHWDCWRACAGIPEMESMHGPQSKARFLVKQPTLLAGATLAEKATLTEETTLTGKANLVLDARKYKTSRRPASGGEVV